LKFLAIKIKIYQPIIPILQKGIDNCGNNQIIDLASGGGGRLTWLNGELLKNNPDLKILLTDYYPNLDAFEYAKNQMNNVDYIKVSVDARDVPKDLIGLRTQFLSLHHFKRMMQNKYYKMQ